jgi:hypothetical protein
MFKFVFAGQGFHPCTPPNELIPASRAEKSSLESQKLSKAIDKYSF